MTTTDTKSESRRRKLHADYHQAAAMAQAYRNTPYAKVFADMRDDAVENIIRYYEGRLNIAPISENTTLRK